MTVEERFDQSLEEDSLLEKEMLQESEYSSEKSLLSEFIGDKDPFFRAKVLDKIVRYGLTTNDPIFLPLIGIETLRVILEEAPSALELSLKRAQTQQEEIAQTAIKKTEGLVAESVKDLIQKTEALQLSRPSKVLIPGLSLFTVVFSLGWLAGIGSSAAWTHFFSSGQRITTLEEASLLSWAKSKDGQQARQLLEWNKSYLESGHCQNDLTELQVTLSMGTQKAISGFCALWVVPTDQRKFER